MRFITVLLLTTASRSEHNVGDQEEKEFVGAEYWTEDYLQQCNEAAPRYGEYSCYVLVRRYERLHIEVLNDNPVLVIFRDFVPNNFVKDFLSDVERKQMIEQTVVKSGDEKSSIISGTRRVNGSWFEHAETPGVGKLFRRVASFLPSVNFESSEPWQVLSYIPGGHYAPHHDFIDYSSPDMWDEWMRIYGNRFATFMIVLQSASRGGGTVFPSINQTVRATTGDAIFWTNMDHSGAKDELSVHGACPVYDGIKIAATLWIRVKGQDIFHSPLSSQHFDLGKIVRPKEDRVVEVCTESEG